MKKLLFLSFVFSCLGNVCRGQFLMDLLDTTKEAGKGLLGIYQKYDNLRIGGYIQPQFQVAGSKGEKSYEGGDFQPNVSNRFMLRRSRIKIDYLHNNDLHQPGVQFVFQFDANERSFSVRDVWGRVFENRFRLFSFTIGMFARPFGYEVNLSSSERESPERGRMSQILMRGERDLGAMVSFDVRKDKHPFKYIKIDAGFFNGQGINAPGDFDNRKDFIGRIYSKPVHLNAAVTLSAGVSLLYGGLLQNTRYVYSTGFANGAKAILLDSSAANKNQYSPRKYYGADMQLKVKGHLGVTEIRAEYITGEQTGTASSSETPLTLMSGSDGFYKRTFNGGYFYLLQQLWNPAHQLVLKYDWYDPNLKVRGKELTATGGFSQADVRFNTFNIGYVHAVSPLLKLSVFYALVSNELTSLPLYRVNLADNVFTMRLQYRF